MNKVKENIDTTFSSKSSQILLKNLVKKFPNPDGGDPVIAVNNVDLVVEDGELITLLGPSGCGKTTMLRMVSGFETPTSGEIYLGDENVVSVPANKRNIAMVFQSYALFPHLTIYENVTYGLKLRKLPKEEIQERADKAIKLMRLEKLKDRLPAHVSGGQQQRVALARAVVIEPKVLLFDEPLSNLDAKLREYMRDELRNLQKRLGITSLYVTHDQSEAMAISDKIVIMNEGIIEQQGTPQEIYEYPNSKFVADFIGTSNVLSVKVEEKSAAGVKIKFNEKSFTIPNPGNSELQIDQTAFAIIRPESIHLVKDEGMLKGVVTKALYYGSKMEYEVECFGETFLIEEYNPLKIRMFEKGEEVNINFDLDSIRILNR